MSQKLVQSFPYHNTILAQDETEIENLSDEDPDLFLNLQQLSQKQKMAKRLEKLNNMTKTIRKENVRKITNFYNRQLVFHFRRKI